MSQLDFNKIKGFICDMDGVIYHGNKVLPGVAEFIHWLNTEKKEYLFLTNNSGIWKRLSCSRLDLWGSSYKKSNESGRNSNF